jgi:hypothetical protein
MKKTSDISIPSHNEINDFEDTAKESDKYRKKLVAKTGKRHSEPRNAVEIEFEEEVEASREFKDVGK